MLGYSSTPVSEADMQTITLQEAQARLPGIIESLPPDGEIVIIKDSFPVAILRAIPVSHRQPRALGTLRGSITYVAPDFDAIPEGFEESIG